MKAVGVAVVVAASLLAGCTTTKVLQRNGCWVRRTERIGNVKEEMGPCVRPQPAWSEDRITRIVQECVARADYRWQGQALAAWSRGDRVPAQAGEADVLRDCMSEAQTSLQGENEGLKTRVSELASERDGLRARADDDRAHLLASQGKLADYLGEAAKKPLPPATATATATSDGRALTEGSLAGAPAQVDFMAPVARAAPTEAPAATRPVSTPAAAAPDAGDPAVRPAPPAPSTTPAAPEPERPALRKIRAARKPRPRIEKASAPPSACPAPAGASPCEASATTSPPDGGAQPR